MTSEERLNLILDNVEEMLLWFNYHIKKDIYTAAWYTRKTLGTTNLLSYEDIFGENL